MSSVERPSRVRLPLVSWVKEPPPPDAPVLEMPLNKLPSYECANLSSGVAAFPPYLVKVKALLFLSYVMDRSLNELVCTPLTNLRASVKRPTPSYDNDQAFVSAPAP